jgi:hypothetical protein
VIALVVSILAAVLSPQPSSSDVASARAVFGKNLDAIRRRDKAAYLSCYWKSEKLARTGADGIALGYAAHEKAAGENWPDTFDASDLELVSLKPGRKVRYVVRGGVVRSIEELKETVAAAKD